MSTHKGRNNYDAFRAFSKRTKKELRHESGDVFRLDTEPPEEEVRWVVGHLHGARSVLELGSGLGVWSWPIMATGVQKYWGVDFIPERVRWASDHRPTPRARFVVGDARAVRLDDKFDVVLLITVLQHLTVPDAIAVLKTAAHHLVPGGRLLMVESDILDADEAECERRYAEPGWAAHVIPKSVAVLQAAEPSLSWDVQIRDPRAGVDARYAHDFFVLVKQGES